MAKLVYMNEEYKQEIMINVDDNSTAYDLVVEGLYPLMVAMGYSPVTSAEALGLEDLLEVFRNYDDRNKYTTMGLNV